MIERVAIDVRTLTRSKYEKRGDQHDRGFDREDRNDVAPEVAQSHDAYIDPDCRAGALIWIKRGPGNLDIIGLVAGLQGFGRRARAQALSSAKAAR
jgi:hypothetical protein